MDNPAPEIEEKFKSFNDNLSQTWQSILKLWTDIGFTQEQIVNRATMVVDALQESLNDIHEGENKLREEINKNLIEYKSKVEMLQMQLNVEAMFDPPLITSQSLLDECRHYKQLFYRLLDIKKERKNKYDSLMSKQSELCELLGEAPYEFTSSKPEMDQDEIENLEQHVHDLSIEKKERAGELRQICGEMLHILRKYQLTLVAGSSLGQFHNGDADFSELSIATENINKVRLSLEKLKSRTERLIEDTDLIREQIRMNWSKYDLKCEELADLVERDDQVVYNQITLDRLIEESKRCHREKMNRIEALIGQLRGEITRIWDELGFVDEDKTEFLECLQIESPLDEDLFLRHEKYLHELTEIYEKRIDLTRKIHSWNQVWNEYTQFEIEYSDPNRFKQKRYSPLIENKLRTKLTSELNKLEKEILFESEQFVRNEGKEFKVNGLKFADLAARKRAEFDKWRQECRLERQAKLETGKKVPGSCRKTPIKRSSHHNPTVQSAQVHTTNTHSRQSAAKKSLASPLKVTSTPAPPRSSAISPVRRTALGQLQPNLMMPPSTIAIGTTTTSTTASSTLAKSLKRRSIKTMHSALKHKNGRKSRGGPPTTATTTHHHEIRISDPHVSCTSPKASASRPVKSAIMPGIRVVDPQGVIIECISPTTATTNTETSSSPSSLCMLSGGIFKRLRLENPLASHIVASTTSSLRSSIDSAAFFSNLNGPPLPQMNSTPLKL